MPRETPDLDTPEGLREAVRRMAGTIARQAGEIDELRATVAALKGQADISTEGVARVSFRCQDLEDAVKALQDTARGVMENPPQVDPPAGPLDLHTGDTGGCGPVDPNNPWPDLGPAPDFGGYT